eukprot:COSAG02_NODE_373_length_23594_cov_6.892190_9_plen_58_part_00
MEQQESSEFATIKNNLAIRRHAKSSIHCTVYCTSYHMHLYLARALHLAATERIRLIV